MRIAKTGIKYFVICVLLAFLFFTLSVFDNNLRNRIIFSSVGGLTILIGLFILYFFRFPKRELVIEKFKNGIILSPADGTVIETSEVEENKYLNARCKKVSIFLSLFDVHINWAPVSGKIEYIKYSPGTFKPANNGRASFQNARNLIGLVTTEGVKISFQQVAGIIARRIECWVKQGDSLSIGQAYGLMRFGSRIDIFLPISSKIEVQLGQKVKGVITKIAEL